MCFYLSILINYRMSGVPHCPGPAGIKCRELLLRLQVVTVMSQSRDCIKGLPVLQLLQPIQALKLGSKVLE
jgi:hypothetical protein